MTILRAGMPLVTKNAQVYTNAAVLGITSDGMINVVTDFGNVLLLTEEEVFNRYEPSESWVEFVALGGITETIGQRLTMQITLLELARSYVQKGTNNDRSPRG